MKGRNRETKEYLLNIKRLDTIIKNKLAEKQRWQEIATGAAQFRGGGERVQSAGNPHKMQDAICRYIDMEREIDEYVDKLVDAKREIIAVLEQLNPTEYDVLHKIYVQYMEYNDVAVAKNQSYSWVTTVHGRALANVRKIRERMELLKSL